MCIVLFGSKYVEKQYMKKLYFYIFRESDINPVASDSSFVEDIESLWINMYERGFIEESDIENLQGNN